MTRKSFFPMAFFLSILLLGFGVLEITPVVASETDSDDEAAPGKADDDDGENRADETRPGRFDFDGGLYTLFAWHSPDANSDFGFSLERARVEMTWRISRHLEGVVETALDDVTASGTPDDLLRDAFIRYAPMNELQFTVGQFKKAFSLFELKSKGKMPIIHRGISNDYLVRDAGYGGRDIGLQIGGTADLPVRIRYALGIFNGSGANLPESDGNGAKDFAGRIEFMTKSRLRTGINLSWKNFDQNTPGNEGKPVSAWMTGADIHWRIHGLRLLAEGIYGINHASAGHPRAASLHGLVAWKFRLPRKGMALMPVARIDWLWPTFSDARDVHAWMGTAGLHWQIEKNLRLMLEYEIVRSSDSLGSTWPDSDCVLAQLALDL